MSLIQIRHEPDGDLIAEGKLGLFDITPFEGNYYIARRCLKTDRFRASWVPGFCPYKFLYIWLDFVARDGTRDRLLAWRYVLPNPIFFFIFLRVGVPQQAPSLSVRVLDAPAAGEAEG